MEYSRLPRAGVWTCRSDLVLGSRHRAHSSRRRRCRWCRRSGSACARLAPAPWGTSSRTRGTRASTSAASAPLPPPVESERLAVAFGGWPCGRRAPGGMRMPCHRPSTRARHHRGWRLLAAQAKARDHQFGLSRDRSWRSERWSS
jgi:hypothetical protein